MVYSLCTFACPEGYAFFYLRPHTPEILITQLLERYAAGERDFSGIEFKRGLRLEDVELPGINLSQSILFGAELSGTNLSRANLNNANLGSACLERTNLREASLIHTIISDGGLIEANLSGADLSFAHLVECPLVDADLTGANLNGTILGLRPMLQGVNLTNVDLSQSCIDIPDGIEDHSLERAIFCNTILPDGTKIISFI